MAGIDELIKQLCPDGAEYKPLGDMVEVRGGWGFPNAEQGIATGDYPFFKVGDMNLPGNEREMKAAQNYVSKETAARLKCKPAPKGTVIFPKIGAAVKTNKKRLLSCDACYDNNVMGLVPASPELNQRFLYYVFVGVELYDLANDSGAVPSIRKGDVERYQIPVPPLEVQQEIVRILDAFTELEANLQRELDARKRQYEYYRDELIQQLHSDGAESKPLKEVAKIVGGRDYKHLEAGNVPVYGSGGIMTSVGTAAYHGPSVLLPRKGSIGNVFYVEGPFWIVDTVFYTEIDTEQILPKFFYQVILSKHIEDLNTSDAARPALTRKVLDAIQLPVPPLETQGTIVAKLDAMVALQDNLRRQIELTHRQYEHYRDRLLDLPRKVA